MREGDFESGPGDQGADLGCNTADGDARALPQILANDHEDLWSSGVKDRRKHV